MKFPVIGINMDYRPYRQSSAVDPQVRDRYDIYTPYVDAVAKAGGLPLLIPCLQDKERLQRYLDLVDGFVFTGGRDYPPELYGEKPEPGIDLVHPRRAAADIELARRVLAAPIPVLGICGGLQLINIAAGGKLGQHLKSADLHRAPAPTRDAFHRVQVQAGTALAAIFAAGLLAVNSAHHQAVYPDHVGNGLRVTARAEDGVIEALESTAERFLLGVQWHPERMADDHGSRIFAALISACRRREILSGRKQKGS